MSLSSEQQKRVEESRAKALALRASLALKAQQKEDSGISNGYHQSSSKLDAKNFFKKRSNDSSDSSAFNVKKAKYDVQRNNNNNAVNSSWSSSREGYSNSPFDMVSKNWSFDLSDYAQVVKKIRELGAKVTLEEIPSYILTVFSNSNSGKEKSSATNSSSAVAGTALDADLSGIDEKLKDTLLPFQREAVNVAVARGGRILIADDMGLGKTIEALTIAAYYRNEWPLLVVCPASVQFAWKQQLLNWLPSVDADDAVVIQSMKDGSEALERHNVTSSNVFILSYDMMVKCHQKLLAVNFKVVIMDETHMLKNPKTARTKKSQPLFKKAQRVILLTGTPALSRPAELYTQLHAVDTKFFPLFHNFGLRYCAAKQMPWGWDYSGSSNLAELHLIMEKKLMIRRLKKDVLTQLPGKYRTMIVLNPSSVKINKSMTTSQCQVDNLKGSEKRGALLEYFHETGDAKVKAIIEYVTDLLEADKKFLLFAHHQNVLDAVEEAVRDKYSYIRVDGRTSAESRSCQVERFQCRDSTRIALLSIQAANAGINLSAAPLVVFAELFWNPGILIQAEDRAHRIGQLDSVNVQYLVAKNTADDYLWPMIQHKLNVLTKAGLSKDDFTNTDTHQLEDQQQMTMLDFLEDENVEDQSKNSTFSSASKQQEKTPHGQMSITQYVSSVQQPASSSTHHTASTEQMSSSSTHHLAATQATTSSFSSRGSSAVISQTCSTDIDDLWDDNDDDWGDIDELLLQTSDGQGSDS